MKIEEIKTLKPGDIIQFDTRESMSILNCQTLFYIISNEAENSDYEIEYMNGNLICDKVFVIVGMYEKNDFEKFKYSLKSFSEKSLKLYWAFLGMDRKNTYMPDGETCFVLIELSSCKICCETVSYARSYGLQFNAVDVK